MHPAWRFLAADSAPFIASFLYRTFIQTNIRTLPQQELASRLQDYLYFLQEQYGNNAFSKSVRHYLDDWSSDDHGWLRKYYPINSDELHYDITPATEKAIDWLASLGKHQFVGTESRLKSVFALLHEVTEGTEVDPQARIAELEKRKAQIEADIQRIREGQVALLDATQIKDRFLQMAGTARGLLSDFRTVEQNFRDLDRMVRERIATWEGSKGALLEEIFGERDVIADSDQGKSFRAFWDFLMSPARQGELSELLHSVLALEAVQELSPDRRLLRIHYDWMEAGEVAQRTVARLSEQLRRYLDDQVLGENRRIMRLIRDLEQSALAVHKQPPGPSWMDLNEPAPAVNLALDRPLFRPAFKPKLAEGIVTEGGQDIPADALFQQTYVDKAQLAAAIRWSLQTRHQVSLAELTEDFPLQHGLAELITYLSLAAESDKAVIDESRQQVLSWRDGSGVERRATLPLVVFTRTAQLVN
jgi:flagellar motility protein MotE (MotC chaperone)